MPRCSPAWRPGCVHARAAATSEQANTSNPASASERAHTRVNGSACIFDRRASVRKLVRRRTRRRGKDPTRCARRAAFSTTVRELSDLRASGPERRIGDAIFKRPRALRRSMSRQNASVAGEPLCLPFRNTVSRFDEPHFRRSNDTRRFRRSTRPFGF